MKKRLFDVVYEDSDVVVINKPAGLLSLPDRFDSDIANLRSLLTEEYGKIFMVHRLDKHTTGIMVMAKTAEAHKSLNDQFEHHTVSKIYHALVSGVVDKEEFPINIPISPDPRRKGLMKPSARGKEATTLVKVTQKFRVATLLECQLITGRQHQIRVHCAAIGYPLLVDPDYGKNKEFFLSSIKRRFNLAKNAEERAIISRQTLHAYQLKFTHPTTNKVVEFKAPYPKDFSAVLQVLSKYSAPYSSAFFVSSQP